MHFYYIIQKIIRRLTIENNHEKVNPYAVRII